MHLFSETTVKKILGITDRVDMTPNEMAKNLTVTFFLGGDKNSYNINNFSDKLKKAFADIGVTVIPYEESLVTISFSKKLTYFVRVLLLNIHFIFSGRKSFLKIKWGKKVKKGVVIIMCGEGKEGNLPIDNTIGFKYNPIITILNQPNKVNPNSSFYEHMNMALDLFAWNMTNILITVSDEDWTVYSFNASYPTYSLNKNFNDAVLYSLIPKVAAPVRPPKLEHFIINNNAFNPQDKKYFECIKDIIDSGPLLQKTELYPSGKNIDDLKFRNNFYRWIGSILLDKRNGMSYGFLCRQLPTKLEEVKKIKDVDEDIKKCIKDDKQYFYYYDNLYLKFCLYEENYILKVPDVWVLTSRSGSDKTNLNIECDILKMGLKSGKMILDLPSTCKQKLNARPSFDTGVILAHAVGNAIFASILSYFQPNNTFSNMLSKNGTALAHWHGYIHPNYIKKGYNVYGFNYPSVSCSSHQSAMYAFMGKDEAVYDDIINKSDYVGDIQIELHHGTNMMYSSLVDLANFLLSNKDISHLGHEYLKLYK